MSFLDPYERNRGVSWFIVLRVLIWALLLGLGWLVWWLVAGD